MTMIVKVGDRVTHIDDGVVCTVVARDMSGVWLYGEDGSEHIVHSELLQYWKPVDEPVPKQASYDGSIEVGSRWRHITPSLQGDVFTVLEVSDTHITHDVPGRNGAAPSLPAPRTIEDFRRWYRPVDDEPKPVSVEVGQVWCHDGQTSRVTDVCSDGEIRLLSPAGTKWVFADIQQLRGYGWELVSPAPAPAPAGTLTVSSVDKSAGAFAKAMRDMCASSDHIFRGGELSVPAERLPRPKKRKAPPTRDELLAVWMRAMPDDAHEGAWRRVGMGLVCDLTGRRAHTSIRDQAIDFGDALLGSEWGDREGWHAMLNLYRAEEKRGKWWRS